jgi:murein DD-endopeptidase MepM/ murein hydrolase activator NlpD
VLLDRARKISVIVAPHGSSRSWNRDVPLPLLIAGGAVLASLPVLLIVAFVQIVDLSARSREVESLRAENARLHEETGRIRELEAELTELQEFETRIRRWAGIEFSDALSSERADKGRHRWEREEGLLAEVPSLPPVDGWVSRSFEGGPEGHPGIDLVGETGTAVRAAAFGAVRFAGWDDTFGNLVILDHGNGFTSLYGHNDAVLVETGALVPRGQTIARLGNTGRSSAPHVHFEVRLEEEPLDPTFLLSPKG